MEKKALIPLAGLLIGATLTACALPQVETSDQAVETNVQAVEAFAQAIQHYDRGLENQEQANLTWQLRNTLRRSS